MLIITNPIPWRARVPFSLTYLTSGGDATDLTSYSFATQTFGTAHANRYIIAAIGTRGNAGGTTFPSCTLGGVTATQVIYSLGVGGNDSAAIYIAAVPTGTTGTVAFTTSASAARGSFGLWRLIRSSPTASGTASATGHVSGVYTASLTIPTGGGAIGYLFAAGSAARTWTWVNLTENFDATIEGGQTHTGALSTTAGTPSITATASSTPVDAGGGYVLAAWGP